MVRLTKYKLSFQDASTLYTALVINVVRGQILAYFFNKREKLLRKILDWLRISYYKNM
jgi:L-cystine uptake protein TcyP (sodium:dicarboxylate symporter family)